MNNGMLTSTTDDWATPQDFFDMLDKEFHFTLDPCADDVNHKCKKYYTKEQDGLSQDWDCEVVFMNPPYGKEIGKRVKKASETKGTVVCLLPARTDTKRFHDYIYDNADLRIRPSIKFIKGRLKFGGSKNSAPFPSMLVIFYN